jgi:hypothetical protein
MVLAPNEWADPGQVIFSMALYDELCEDPGRLADPTFTAYLLGSLSSNASRDMFIPVCVLGLNVSISAYIGLQPAALEPEAGATAPAELTPPPALTNGLNMPYLANRDHSRDEAKMVRLLTGGHVGPMPEGRVAIARSALLALAAAEVPAQIRSNLLALASFLQWYEGDPEAAGMNAMLSLMSNPDNKLPGLMLDTYAKLDGPIWREAQKGREEVV